MIITTGPLELSGLAAGVSEEGPIASVSMRLRSAGGVGLAVAGAGVEESASGSARSEFCASGVWETGSGIDRGSAAGADVVVVVFVVETGSGRDAGNVLISTGLEERACWPLPLPGRELGFCVVTGCGDDAVAVVDTG